MTEASETQGAAVVPVGRPSILQAVLWGGATAGALDILDAMVVYGFRGVAPIRILQSVASGLLGRSAYEGGLPTAALGTVLHFFIAFSMATAYVCASLRFPALVRRPVRWGLAFGVAAYFFMQYVVLPLSAVGPRGTFSLPLFVNGVVGHALFVGLPIALLTRRSANAPIPPAGLRTER